MFWNLFEKIINAIKPNEESEQVSDVLQSKPQDSSCQPESSQQSSPDFQETVNATQQDNWQE